MMTFNNLLPATGSTDGHALPATANSLPRQGSE
jgi:hypothetical protein